MGGITKFNVPFFFVR